MTKLIELIKNIQSSTDWENLVIQFVNDELSEDNPSFEMVSELFNEFLEQYKTLREIPIEIKKLLGDGISNSINDFLSDQLQWFFDLDLLRNIDTSNRESAKSVVKIVFDEYILNFGRDPISKIMKHLTVEENTSKQSVGDMLGALNYYVYTSISETINRELISITLQKKANLSDEISDFIASLIHENRIELKINLIIKSMKRHSE